MQLINESPFAACLTVEMDSEACEVLALTAKATYRLYPHESPALADKQRDIAYADIFNGEPGLSSIAYESDITIGKTATDIVLVGHAFPQKVGDRETWVMVSVGKHRKTVKVFGDRYWDSVMGVTTKSRPEPFEKIPLIYERSFGGVDSSHPNPKYHESEERNPVGTGFRARHSHLPIDGTKLPNIENPKQLISSPKDRPEPAGFGFIARNWLDRRMYAGTYDSKWMQSRMPLVAQDFDPRFFSAASPGLAIDRWITGGETIRVVNASVHGPMSITIPAVNLSASYLIDAKPVDIDLFLDTVLVDTDRDEMILIWHGMANIHGQVDRLKWAYVNVVR